MNVKRIIIMLTAVAVVALGSGCATESASGSGSTVGSAPSSTAATKAAEKHNLLDDVKLTSCKKTEYAIEFAGTLTNTSKELSSYVLQVEILDAKGDRVDEGGTFANSVKPGQTVKIDGVGMGDVATLPSKVTCRVMTADRMADQ